VEVGDVEGVESSTEEPAIEDLPEPPALSVEDTVKEMEEHHSITVTVTLVGIGQQVKQLLDEAVSSQS
jgi:hypothetical protein